MADCRRCDGCGLVANTDEMEPWTAWTGLPLRSSAAVLLGFVKPIACPACKGSGRETPPSGEGGEHDNI